MYLSLQKEPVIAKLGEAISLTDTFIKGDCHPFADSGQALPQGGPRQATRNDNLTGLGGVIKISGYRYSVPNGTGIGLFYN
jgi:hypothetical protein